MDISKLIFTNETKNTMEKDDKRRVGELRWNKLKELEKNGRLATATNRKEITKMLGYDSKNVRVYNWISNLIRRGNLIEELDETSPAQNGQMSFKYYIAYSPSFHPNSKAKKKTSDVVKPVATKPQVVAKPNATTGTTKLTIRYGELVIELEGVNQDIIYGIVDKLAGNRS